MPHSLQAVSIFFQNQINVSTTQELGGIRGPGSALRIAGESPQEEHHVAASALGQQAVLPEYVPRIPDKGAWEPSCCRPSHIQASRSQASRRRPSASGPRNMRRCAVQSQTTGRCSSMLAAANKSSPPVPSPNYMEPTQGCRGGSRVLSHDIIVEVGTTKREAPIRAA